MFGLGPAEILLIVLIIIVLFGAKKIPEVMRGLGTGLREFRKATSEATHEIKRAIDEPPAESAKAETPKSESKDV